MVFFFLFKVRIVVLLKYPFPLCQNNIPKPLFPFQRSGIHERCKIQEGARQRCWQLQPFSPPCSLRSHAKNNPQETQLCSESRQQAESERPARRAAPGQAKRPAPHSQPRTSPAYNRLTLSALCGVAPLWLRKSHSPGRRSSPGACQASMMSEKVPWEAKRGGGPRESEMSRAREEGVPCGSRFN